MYCMQSCGCAQDKYCIVFTLGRGMRSPRCFYSGAFFLTIFCSTADGFDLHSWQ
ncbi:hypothetical protein FLA_3672 [Filimonas lacunae]|nr:hypothetical protein FLA_3672 [Filimonas lacunae]